MQSVLETSRCCCCCFCFFFYCLLLQCSLSWLHRKEGLSASWLRIKTASPTAQLSLRVVGCFQSVGVAKGIMTSSCEWQMQIGGECGGLILTFFTFFLLWGTLVVSSPDDAPRETVAQRNAHLSGRARSRAFLWVSFFFKPSDMLPAAAHTRRAMHPPNFFWLKFLLIQIG